MNKKAVALAIGLMVTMVLTVISSVVLMRSAFEQSVAQRHGHSSQAFWLAEAGAQHAIWQLNYGAGNWTAWATVGSAKTLTANFAMGSYSVQVDNPSGVNPVISVTGYSPEVSNTNAIPRALDITLAGASQSPFTFAAFGKDSVAMSGNGESDSYDSSQGAYGQGNVAVNGDVGTNGVAAGAITLSGNAKVNGDVSTGPEGTIRVNGNAGYTGEPSDDNAIDLPSVEVQASLTGLSSSGTYTVNANNHRALASGDYKFNSVGVSGNGRLTINGPARIYLTAASSAFDITGNGQVIINGQVTIYTEGRCNIAGNGVVNNANVPANFLIYSKYSGAGNGVAITGNGNFYGAVYAPDSAVQVSGNGNVFGSLVGKSVSIPGNGDVHYDEALKNVGGGAYKYSVSRWREEQNPYAL